MNKNNIIFLVNNLALGGLEKVNVSIANNISLSYNTTLYSLKADSYGYDFSNTLTYIEGKSSFINCVKHPMLTCKALYGKTLIQKKNLNLKNITTSINFKNFDSIILSEADILYAPQILEINPNIKIIGWIHSTFDSYKNKYMKDSYKEFLDSLNVVDKLIVLTNSDKKSFMKVHSNVIKINNPVTIEYEKNNLIEKKNTKIISFVGRLDYQIKGLDFLLEIAQYLPQEWKIFIAGDGPDKNRFEADIKHKNLCDKFELKGILKKNDLIQHYKQSELFILTSRWEGFGLVITEAMNFGLPVIAFDSEGPREIIGKNNEYGILVKSGNVMEFVEWINKMIEDKELRNQYSKKSLERREDYQLENIGKQWKNILD